MIILLHQRVTELQRRSPMPTPLCLNFHLLKAAKLWLVLTALWLLSGRLLAPLAGKSTLNGPDCEIALKAWQCRERKGEPDHSHDLLELFDRLEPGTRELLKAEVPSFEPLLKTLCSHRDAHTLWRYIHEDPGGVFHTASLNRALTVIIDAYDKRWGDSA